MGWYWAAGRTDATERAEVEEEGGDKEGEEEEEGEG